MQNCKQPSGGRQPAGTWLEARHAMAVGNRREEVCHGAA